MTLISHAGPYGRFIETERRTSIEQIKVPVSLGAVLAIETMQEPWSNLEDKENLSILKNVFSTFSNKTSVFFQHWNEQVFSYPNLHCLVGQIQFQKPTLVGTTYQMPNRSLRVSSAEIKILGITWLKFHLMSPAASICFYKIILHLVWSKLAWNAVQLICAIAARTG